MRQAIAAAAAKAAAGYLEGAGFRILDRDWRCDDQLVSILAEEQGTFVVAELRVKAGSRHGAPLDVIDPARQRMLRSLAGTWLAGHRMSFAQARIDVIGLLQQPGAFTIEHIRAAG